MKRISFWMSSGKVAFDTSDEEVVILARNLAEASKYPDPSPYSNVRFGPAGAPKVIIMLHHLVAVTVEDADEDAGA